MKTENAQNNAPMEFMTLEDVMAIIDIDLSGNLIDFAEYYLKILQTKLAKYTISAHQTFRRTGKNVDNAVSKLGEAMRAAITCFMSPTSCPFIQEAYDLLIVLINDYVCVESKKNENFDAMKFSKDVMAFYVKRAKFFDQKIPFLKYFDDNGNVLPQKARELSWYVFEVCKKYNTIFPDIISQSIVDKLIVSKEDIEKAIEIEEEERLTRIEKLAAEKEKIVKAPFRSIQPIKKIEPKKSIYDSPKYKELLQVYNPTTEEIKKGVCQKYDFDAFVAILEKFFDKPEDKSRIKSCIEQYKNQIREIRFNRLKRVLKKHELESLNDILKNSENEDAKVALNRYINSDEFNLDSDSDVRDNIIDIINEMVFKDNNALCNFIIFPDSNLLDDEMSKFTAEKTHHRLDTVIGENQTQFRTLQAHSIQDIKSKKKDEFHELWWEKGKAPLTIDKLKFYRYGHHKAKMAMATIPVTEKNQEVLNKYFNTTMQSAIVVIGLSNVIIEDEQVFYQSVRKYAASNKDRLTEICKIFSNDFTDDTRAKAIELITNSKLIIDAFMKNSEEDEKRNTLRPNN